MALKVGDTATLKATITPENADNLNYSFATSNDKVATVTPKVGKVTAVAAGTATITVTTEDGSKTASCEVTVTAAQSEAPKAPEAPTDVTSTATKDGATITAK
ncbi:Ig-like domain-containing protein [Companilactobacillus mindensis]|uniref:Ig-like domain-containing protein n=1 Tax=Companilactobacillus mindensis TaxID=167481 RepID=UPI001F37E50D|nr:Ig-like domain-containing protein [Companilactobacillus mindensis]